MSTAELATSVDNVQEEISKDEITNEEAKDESELCKDQTMSSFRIQIQNVPKFFNIPQMKKLVQKQLPKVEYRKLKIFESNCYVSFLNEEDVVKAVSVLEGLKIKNSIITVKRVAEEPNRDRRPRSPKPLRSAREITTPLADLSYEKQLAQKQESSKQVALRLKRDAISAGIQGAREWIVERLVKPIKPSPVMDQYRNKSELTVGYDEHGNVCVGFVATKLQEKRLITTPVYDCPHLRPNTLNVNRAFEEFVKNSELPPFNEFERKGCWKSILIRDFLADCMVVVTVFPFEDQALLDKAKKELIQLFMSTEYEACCLKSFRVTSLYLAVQEHSSDIPKLEKLAGAPFVYERLFGLKFRVSPNTFFQTNTFATEVLYSTIADSLGIPEPEQLLRLPMIVGAEFATAKSILTVNNASTGEPAMKKAKVDSTESESSVELETVENGDGGTPTESKEEPDSKKMKLDGVIKNDLQNEEKVDDNRLLVLDICCGAGTIGLSLANRLEQAKKHNKFTGTYGLLGVELIREAIADAELNAKDNNVPSDCYKYVPGRAEAIFQSLDFFVPPCFKKGEKVNLQPGEIVGVLDPPRAGMCDKVIKGCRKLTEMKRMVYVSCDPSAALKNVVDLCRPESRKFEGTPFTVTQIQPVDMFPQTNHFEWVIQLDRQ